MAGDWLSISVALMMLLVTSGALDLQVPIVDMETFDVRSLVQRENEKWNLEITVSWERPDGIEPEGYMVQLKDTYADVMTDPQGIAGGDFIDDLDFGIDFADIFGSPAAAQEQTARERLENRGFVFVETEYYSAVDMKFTHHYEIEVVVLNNNESAGRGVVHRFITPDCYSSTYDLNFCGQQEVVFASKPANISLLNVSVTCVEVDEETSDDVTSEQENGEDQKTKTVAMATAWVSWIRPVQQGGDIISYVIRLEHDGSVQDGAFDPSVTEDLTRDPLVPIKYHLRQVELNQTYTLQVTPFVNKTGDFSPYGMMAQLTFHTYNLSADHCFPAAETQATSRAGAEATAGASGGAGFLAPGVWSTLCTLVIFVGHLFHLNIASKF